MLFFKRKEKPTINYIEIHITDSCNLKCNYCTHFCHLVDKFILIDFNEFKKDIEVLSKKININTIRLLGGEPLLNPNINDFMKATRDFFPNSTIKLVTNGLLLKHKDAEFWKVFKENNIKLDLSYYPLYKEYLDEVKNILKENNAEDTLWVAKQYIFADVFNPKGNSNKNISYRNCTRKECPNLWNHKLYICPDCFRYYYNKKNKTNIELPPYADIYKQSGEKIYKIINSTKAPKACKYCKEIPIAKRWEHYKSDNQ